MLSNAYFVAKFRFDTAENEPAKNCKILLIFPNLLTLTPNSPTETEVASPARAEPQGAASTKDRRRRKNDLYPLDDDVRLRGLHCDDTFISENVL